MTTNILKDCLGSLSLSYFLYDFFHTQPLEVTPSNNWPQLLNIKQFSQKLYVYWHKCSKSEKLLNNRASTLRVLMLELTHITRGIKDLGH